MHGYKYIQVPYSNGTMNKFTRFSCLANDRVNSLAINDKENDLYRKLMRVLTLPDLLADLVAQKLTPEPIQHSISIPSPVSIHQASIF